eukprot:Phypoly_transcript_18390.p1 GENE.Phypoly_transcript_18390~~Phypoly_transcript_18390.p1  ORF type:complete len:214 (+),score=36.76 Phypoly_transcript_18390:107-748(+)
MDGIEFLINDHKYIESLFEQYKVAKSAETRRRLANEMIRELSMHTVIEEMHLYPLCRLLITENDEGKKLSEHGLKEHRHLKEELDKLLDMDEHSEEFDNEVHHVMKKTLHHHGDEEKDIFPQLRKHATHEQLLQFGNDLHASRKVAPTHPHPHAPDQPPFNSIVAPFLHAVDSILDTNRVFPGDGVLTSDHLDKKYPDVALPTAPAQSSAPSI